ncbi:DNA-binding FadR family transcriptional regulator [Oikeobacillus pervagus]|uniref:DNA-binding FadR family transcriptional regulator n=1 Tax=Oikeobacillus pervagus TaxID=1325931 RepID=A0AAJ1T542_9BACI|nr:GntR family transcriptional regulator [Oikeobacillus pervagus]MDQ0214985.1 DNA-binding FadR family transcriptional regulator [Oikeobacillus pervagus]
MEKKATSKFVEIVDQIRLMISTDGLVSGDRLPSERELSERLNVGRSSVREALRALELLGLIETRRGEGTFVKEFRDHRLVELLSTFILQDERTKRDVQSTKQIVELGSFFLILKNKNLSWHLDILEESVQNETWTEMDFFSYLLDLANNQLLKKIWYIITDYAQSIQKQDRLLLNKSYFLELIGAFKTRNLAEVYEKYYKIQNLSKNN